MECVVLDELVEGVEEACWCGGARVVSTRVDVCGHAD